MIAGPASVDANAGSSHGVVRGRSRGRRRAGGDHRNEASAAGAGADAGAGGAGAVESTGACGVGHLGGGGDVVGVRVAWLGGECVAEDSTSTPTQLVWRRRLGFALLVAVLVAYALYGHFVLGMGAALGSAAGQQTAVTGTRAALQKLLKAQSPKQPLLIHGSARSGSGNRSSGQRGQERTEEHAMLDSAPRTTTSSAVIPVRRDACEVPVNRKIMEVEFLPETAAYGGANRVTVTCGDGMHSPKVMYGRAAEHSPKSAHAQFDSVLDAREPVVLNGSVDLIIGQCTDDSNKDWPERVNVHWANHVDPLLLKKASATAEALVDKGLASPEFSKLNVVLLQFDAVSRNTFTKQLPITNAFLEQLNTDPSSPYKTFTFTRYNVIGYDTSENIPGLYSGFSYVFHKKLWGWLREGLEDGEWDWPASDEDLSATRQHLDANGTLRSPNTWIWDYYSSRGYVTLHGEELCLDAQVVNRYFPPERRRSFADVRTGDVFCHKQYCCCCIPETQPENRLCMGPVSSFRHSFKYLLEYQRNYHGAGRLATYNFLIGHEPSMTSLPQMDVYLTDYLQAALLGAPYDRTYVPPQLSEETILILHGDHGLQYGDFAQTMEGVNEHKNPPLVVAVPRWILDKFPWMERALTKNQARFITAFDIYNSLKSIPAMGVSANAPEHVDERSDERAGQRLNADERAGGDSAKVPPWSFNIFRDVVPKSRTCPDAHVPYGYCGQLRWSPLVVKELRKFAAAARRGDLDVPIIVRLAQLVVDLMNADIAESRASFPRVCHELAVLDIKEAFHTTEFGQNRTKTSEFVSSLRFDRFRVVFFAAPLRDVARLEPLEVVNPSVDEQIITVETVVQLAPSTRLPVVLFKPDSVDVHSVRRVSKRSVHEPCMGPRDPNIAAAYCVCDLL